MVSYQGALPSEKDASRCKLVSPDEETSSLRQAICASPAFVVKLSSTCDTPRSKTTARTSGVAALRARPSVVASGPTQSKYGAVVLERDYFVYIFRSLAVHTSRLEDEFADLFHQTRASRHFMQRHIRPLFENFWLQPDITDVIDGNGSASIEETTRSSLNFLFCLYLALASL